MTITINGTTGIADQPQKVQDICNAAWTPEVIAAYEAQQAANQLPTAE